MEAYGAEEGVTCLRFCLVPSGGCGENGLQGTREEAGRRLLQ